MRLKHGLLLSAAIFAAWAAGAANAETILNRGNAAEPSSLDVQLVSGIPEGNIQQDLYEGLMAYGPDGKAIPGVAASWTVSTDGLDYTFKLRDDAKWSDGSPVTSDDFAFAWRRIVTPKTAADYAYFLDAVKNAEDIRNGKADPATLGVETPDPKTFVVHLRAPAPYFVGMLVHQSTFPIDKALFEKAGDGYSKPNLLISNGAYTLAEAIPQDHITLKKNPYFHDAANVKIDTVRYFPTEDLDSELKRYLAGELDLTYDIASQQIPTMLKDHPKETHIAPYFGTYFYAINLTHEPWKSNVDLRHALSLAIDRDVIVKDITKGQQIPTFTFVPPGTSNFPAWQPDEARMTQAEREAKARELIAKAGYGPDKPLSVEFIYNTNEAHKKVAIAVAAMWKQKLGINTTLKNEEWGTFQADRNNKTFKDVARHGWIGDFDDAANFLDLERGNVGANSTSGYDNPAFDKLMAEATTETDLAKRGVIQQNAEKIMIADQPIIPLYTYTNKHMISPAVHGWIDNLPGFNLTRWLTKD
ncbi:MAG: peptide ABC transporter substrate-binding protein [Azospirillaceae bacterium]|nr:peptide ABC transporter substrate-binding protein [Azospirillaceae bacterium]